MIAKLFSLALIFIIVYIVGVFLVPNIADQYGDPVINAQIRTLKTQAFEFSSGATDAKSLYEKIKEKGSGYKEKTEDLYQNIEGNVVEITETLSGKVQDIKEAADSAQKAYDAVKEAQNDIEKIISLSGTLSN